jgi:hypothetical protein
MLKMINPKLCSDGWLVGKNEDSAETAYLSCLKVDTTEQKGGRQYFIIKEGPLKGQKGSVLPVVNGTPSLVDVKHDSEGLIFVDFKRAAATDVIISGKLWMGARPVKPKPIKPSGHDARDALAKAALEKLYQFQVSLGIPLITLASNPMPKDWNPLEIPDAPHKGGLGYRDKSSVATVWFRIGHEGDRYFHAGQRTGGCGTVEPDRWTPIYNYLISKRKDIKSVGAIHVAYET